MAKLNQLGDARSIWRNRIVWQSLFLSVCTVWLSSALAQESELHIKAAFLYKFCGYTNWPSTSFTSDEAPLVISIMASADVVQEIQSLLQGKSVGNRSVLVNDATTEAPAEHAHLLYIHGQFLLLATDVAKVRTYMNKPVLIVTEAQPQPIYSVINFVRQDPYIRFQISRSRAEMVGLKLSSQLLSVAAHVR